MVFRFVGCALSSGFLGGLFYGLSKVFKVFGFMVLGCSRAFGFRVDGFRVCGVRV